MTRYFTIDGGTTNTRVTLVCDKELCGTRRIPYGARAGIDGGERLRASIREAIAELLSENSLTEHDVKAILAAGMITSEFGLCNLAHLTAPVGIAELHARMHQTALADISKIPFVFIPGVKTVGEDVSQTDMMRGEETELIGLTDTMPTDTLFILPGSHSKLIETDAEGRITRFSTMLTGEMIASLSAGTILKDAVDLSQKSFHESSLWEGCRYAAHRGLNEALFKVRILKNIFQKDPMEVYSFFLGAILSAEISAIAASPASRVVIGGRAQIKHATAALLARMSDKEIVTVSDERAESATAYGMIKIYEYTQGV